MAGYKLKINSGWKCGSVRDEELKINPNLLELDELEVSKKQTNMCTFKNLPQMCETVGLKIVKNYGKNYLTFFLFYI